MLVYLARDERLDRRREVRRGGSSSSTPIAYVLGAIVDRGGKCEKETRRAAPLNRFRGGFSVPRGLRLLAPLLESCLLRVDVRDVRARRRCLGVGIRLADRKAPLGDALAFDVRLGGEEALAVEHVHEAPVAERPRRYDPLPVFMVSNEIKVVHAQPLAALPADARDPVPGDVLYDRPSPRPAPLPGEAVLVAVDAPELGYGRLVAAPRRQCDRSQVLAHRLRR